MGGAAREALLERGRPGTLLAVGLLPVLAGDLPELLPVVLPADSARFSSLGR